MMNGLSKVCASLVIAFSCFFFVFALGSMMISLYIGAVLATICGQPYNYTLFIFLILLFASVIPLEWKSCPLFGRS